VRSVIQTAERVTGRTIPVRIAPRRPGDPPVLIAGSGKIAQALGWRPQRQDLTVIIRSAWEWMQQFRGATPHANPNS
jgi:UDP-glucose 4-epimerase